MENMHKDIQTRLSDQLMMNILIWVSNPRETYLCERLSSNYSDEILRSKFRDGNFIVWKTNDLSTKYPLLWDKAQLYAIAFQISYLVESRFSRV